MTDSEPTPRLTGGERLHGDQEPPAASTVMDFWGWAYGDLRPNNIRGVFAEWLVARLLGIDCAGRDPWAVCDLVTSEGITIEVKSCAYLQSWHSAESPPSVIGFSVPKTRAWSTEEGHAETPTHNAMLYVFCVQTETDPRKWDALDLGQWRFHVLTVAELAALGVSRISLKRLTHVAPSLTAAELSLIVRQKITTLADTYAMPVDDFT